jgi:hypothetical protein
MRKLVLAALLLVGSFSVLASDCTQRKPESLDNFLERFSTDHDFANTRTIFPLRVLKWEFGLDEKGKDVSAPEKWKISRSDYAGWPRLDKVLKDNKQLASRISSNSGTKAIFEIFQPNTDWIVLFHFKSQKGCWYFWQYEDRSLS